MSPRRKKRGLGPRTRGRHKHFKSRETRLWKRLKGKKKPTDEGGE